MYQDQGNSANR